MWPFKWQLSVCTFTWCFLFFKILENEICKSGRNLPLTTFGIERVKTSIFLTMSINVHMLPHHLFLWQTSRRSSTNYRSPPDGRHQGKLNRPIVPFVTTKTTMVRGELNTVIVSKRHSRKGIFQDRWLTFVENYVREAPNRHTTRYGYSIVRTWALNS